MTLQLLQRPPSPCFSKKKHIKAGRDRRGRKAEKTRSNKGIGFSLFFFILPNFKLKLGKNEKKVKNYKL